MIPHEAIDRLIGSTFGAELAQHANVERTAVLIGGIVSRHGLDVEDVATLWRIAAGEAIEHTAPPLPTLLYGNRMEDAKSWTLAGGEYVHGRRWADGTFLSGPGST